MPYSRTMSPVLLHPGRPMVMVGEARRSRTPRDLDAAAPEWSAPKNKASGKRRKVVAAASVRASTAQEPLKRLKPRD
eukprot:5756515-Prymnesium_polylepis.1